MYADDTIISVSSNSFYTISNAVNEDLLLLKTWLDEDKLSLNVTETQSLLVGTWNKRTLRQADSPKLYLAVGGELISSATNKKHFELQVE